MTELKSFKMSLEKGVILNELSWVSTGLYAVVNVNELNGFACAVSSTPGTIWYQQKAGMYAHNQGAWKEGPGAISQLSWYQQ